MAKRGRKALTQRELQCRKVAREKALRKLMHGCWVRLRLGLAALLLAAGISAGVWEYRSAGITQTVQQTVRGVYQMTAHCGFAVQAMYMEGRSRTPLKDVQKALGIKRGEPIFALSLEEVRERLEALPTVKHAAIERALPSTLYVRLAERTPVAIWQHGGQMSLIDDEGTVMSDLALEDYKGLPLVTGDGAPRHVMEILDVFASQPDLEPLITAAVRVGDRRWDVHLQGGVQVRLPEENPEAAWRKLAALQQEQHVLDRAVRAIDLRAKDRMYIKLNPVALPGAPAAPARET